MAEFNFNFCPNTRVAEVIAPDEPQVRDFNGWDYTPQPIMPFRRQLKVTLEGLFWRFNPSTGAIDYAMDPETNAGVLESFYAGHRLHKPFNFQHEWLGLLEFRFASPVSVPKAVPNSGGLLEPFEVQMIHHNPSY